MLLLYDDRKIENSDMKLIHVWRRSELYHHYTRTSDIEYSQMINISFDFVYLFYLV